MEPKVVNENLLSPSNYQKLAENLRNILKSHDLNANQLGHLLGIPMMTIRRLLSGETTDPRVSTLKLIAGYFNVSVDSLIDGNYGSIKTLNKSRSCFVPKIEWETAERITSINELDLSKWKEWQSITIGEKDTLSPNAFALQSRPSMYPRFPQGTLFIFDPDINPKDGDLVLIKLKKNKELTIRELVIDPPEWQLHPIVEGSNILHYSETDYEIVGINLLTMLYSRKVQS